MSSPISNGGTPSMAVVNPPELECRSRSVTPGAEDHVKKLRAEAKRDYDELIALGGRPSRSIRLFPIQKEVDVTSEDTRAITHWGNEAEKRWEELDQWKKLKEAQRINNHLGRSETELELENTDVYLFEVLSKLNDWQEFEFIQQNKVYQAEWSQVQCQRAITRLQNATVAASGAEQRRALEALEAPRREWMRQMREGQERLEASEERMMWVKGQWPEVLAEASQLIAAASPELQRQLENKLEKQTNAIYRHLLQLRARPSHAVHPPDKNAGLAQRLDHWISESSGFTAELRDWKGLMAWRRHVKGADSTKQEKQEQPSLVDPCPELFEDLVKYRQYELDRATSWVDCWRSRETQLREAKKSTSLPKWGLLPGGEKYYENDVDYRQYETARTYGWKETGVTDAGEAEIFASEAEETVSVAAKRLEQSKQELQRILAQLGRPSGGGTPAEDSEGQLPPTPPRSQSPENLPMKRRPSHKSEKGHRRSRKKEVRKSGVRTGNTNTKQQALPKFSDPNQVEPDQVEPNQLEPDQVEEDDNTKDVEMSDVQESAMVIEVTEALEGRQPKEEEEVEDTVMADIEDPEPTAKPISKKTPSPGTQGPTSRKTGAAAKLNQPFSGRIPKNKNKDNKKPGKKSKAFTEQQTMLLLNAASTNCPPTNHTASLDAALTSNPPTDATPPESIPLRRSERLKKKTTTSVAVASPPRSLNAVESSRVSKPKKGKMRADAVGL